MEQEPGAQAESRSFAAERPKAFVDAVVAIAMTLLILPLMESVSDVASSGEDASTWLTQHADQLISFLLSFVIIAMFWFGHHRLFANVERVTGALLWLLTAWLLSIVWLPVTTALAGLMPSDDLAAVSLYIGTMIVTALVSLLIRIYLHRHSELHRVPRLREGMADDLALATLFAVALALMLLVPALGYYAMLVMLASRPTQLLFYRLMRIPRTG